MSSEKRLSTIGRHLSWNNIDTGDNSHNDGAKSSSDQNTLTIIDNRTGKSYSVQISEGNTIKAADLKTIKVGEDDKGIRTYDPGYTNTAACISRICYIDGDQGILRYRGYPIEQLAEEASFMEVSYLLLYGGLPSTQKLQFFEETVMRHTALPSPVIEAMAALPHDAHPMGVIITGLCALSTCHPEQNPALSGQSIYDAQVVQDKQIVRLIGKIPTIAAHAYHRSTGRFPSPPNQKLSYSENFLYMLDAGSSSDYRPHPRLVRAMDIMFTLHAEHEMNCSTAAARHLASSGVDVYTAVAGAIGALYGPLHGGANEAVLRMLERIGNVANIPKFLEGVKTKQEKLFGFGHRVYKNFDPRAKIIRQVAEEVFQLAGRDPLIDIAVALQDAARSDPYFVDRKLYPNVDFFSGLVYRSLGFPPQFFTVLFAIPRVVGYLSHWREQLSDKDAKIIRPQQDYRGIAIRQFVPLKKREVGPQFDGGPTQLKPSNAYQRRIAGSAWS